MRNADGVRNLRKIIDDEQNLFIIVSAMGKTTNALEKVFEGLQKGDKQLSLEHVESLRKYHAEIIDELWHEPKRLPAVLAVFLLILKVAVGLRNRRHQETRHRTREKIVSTCFCKTSSSVIVS